MRNRFNALLGAATFAIGLTGATTVFAQAEKTPAQPPAAKEQAAPGMMEGQGMMGQQGDGMMKMMTQMSEMMDSCNKMMQAKATPQDQGTTPQKQGS